MPIFDYRCADCGAEFELIILHNSPAPECPACHGGDIQKLLSMYAVSSEGTRQSSLRGMKQRNAAVRKDLAHEEHKRFHDHDH